MTKSGITRKKNIIIKDTKAKMMQLGVYREEFQMSIERYAELRFQYDLLQGKWIDEDCVVTEKYTNKAGATNEKKAVVFATIEAIRKELLEFENALGLTPKGLKVLKSKGLEQNKKGKLAELLDGITT